MAGFGFSLGDIALVSTYAYKVYRSCQDAGESFAVVTADVSSLRSLLVTLDNESADPRSSLRHLTHAQQGELAVRLDECKTDLGDVKKVLHQFRSLNSKDPRFRDRLAFTNAKQAALRERLGTHSERIQTFLAGINVATFSRIEHNTEAHMLSLSDIRARLDEIHRDLLSGRRDISRLQSIGRTGSLQEEVIGDSMTEVDVDVSHEIADWLKKITSEQETNASPDPSFGREEEQRRIWREKLWQHPEADREAGRGGVAQVERDGCDEEEARRPGGQRRAEQGGKSEAGLIAPVIPRYISTFRKDHMLLSSEAETETLFLDVTNETDVRKSRFARPECVLTYDDWTRSWNRCDEKSTIWRIKSIQALFVSLELPKELLLRGTRKSIVVKRRSSNGYGKSKVETLSLTVDVPGRPGDVSPHLAHNVLYLGLGNRWKTGLKGGWVARTNCIDILFHFYA